MNTATLPERIEPVTDGVRELDVTTATRIAAACTAPTALEAVGILAAAEADRRCEASPTLSWMACESAADQHLMSDVLGTLDAVRDDDAALGRAFRSWRASILVAAADAAEDGCASRAVS